MVTRSDHRSDHLSVDPAYALPEQERPTQWRTVALSELELRDDVPEGEPHFRGWACRNEVRDAYGTTFQAGTWAAGGLDGEPYALCWMHDPWIPVGAFTASDRAEGLWIEGRWDGTRDGRDARTKAHTSAPGLSVGFRSVIFDEEDPDRIIAARLVEVSQITARMAAVPGSKFSEARSSVPAPDPGGLALARRSLVVARHRLRATQLITR